ncbi:MAG: ankyrin repeat domain-containing protein [Planctomycetota bacterium]
MRYYTAKVKSGDAKERVAGVDGLLGMGRKGIDALADILGGGDNEAQFIVNYWLEPNKLILNNRPYGHFPLHEVASWGYADACELLIEKGAEVNAKAGGWGQTPLYWAVSSGHKAVSEILIAKGADVNAKEIWGKTPLHNAASCGRKSVAEILIENGANVNARDRHDWTPLHFVIYGQENLEVAKLLIKKGADINAIDNKGRTPLDRAKGRQRLFKKSAEMVSFLRAHGGKTGKELKNESGKK